VVETSLIFWVICQCITNSKSQSLPEKKLYPPQKWIFLEKCSLLTLFTAHLLVYSYASLNVLAQLVVLEPANAVRQRPLHLSSDRMPVREHLQSQLCY